MRSESNISSRNETYQQSCFTKIPIFFCFYLFFWCFHVVQRISNFSWKLTMDWSKQLISVWSPILSVLHKRTNRHCQYHPFLFAFEKYLFLFWSLLSIRFLFFTFFDRRDTNDHVFNFNFTVIVWLASESLVIIQLFPKISIILCSNNT